jgi:hypothetical protein
MPHLDVLWNGGENVGLSPATGAMAAGVPVVASTPTNCEIIPKMFRLPDPLGIQLAAPLARHTDHIADAQLVLPRAANRQQFNRSEWSNSTRSCIQRCVPNNRVIQARVHW